LSMIEDLMGHPEFINAFHEEESEAVPAAETSLEDPLAPAVATPINDDVSVDELAEQAAGESDQLEIDVRALWQKLIAVESEQTIEGIALGESVYKRDLQRLLIPFELGNGIFDFSKGDTVGVERLERERWYRIGSLDLRSRPDIILIEGFDSSYTSHIEEGTRLRFVSHYSLQSLKRRQDAVTKILEGRSRIPTLFDVFDGKLKTPTTTEHQIDQAALDGYGLNLVQKKAFESIIRVRPLGILQGPPGTGKTAFIGALAHYALTHGLASNILVASQSHEAVNIVAEVSVPQS
jgi:hypothetical protein